MSIHVVAHVGARAMVRTCCRTSLREAVRACQRLRQDEKAIVVSVQCRDLPVRSPELLPLRLSQAMDAFQTAADYYAGEEATSSANQCLLKVQPR
eukprot:2006552-Pleurochrysis_carterae.AAC.2